MDASFFDDTLGSSSSSIQFDFRTFLATVGLVAIGLISIYSATYDAGASAIFKSQLYYAIGGLVIAKEDLRVFAQRRHPHDRWFNVFLFVAARNDH